MAENKLCLIFNYAPHYRAPVYKRMDEEFRCTFFFGNNDRLNIRKLDYTLFKIPAIECNTVHLTGNLYWISGTVGLVFKDFQYYILTGEPRNLSSWLILILCRLLKKKCYLWSHGWYGSESGLKALIKKAYFRLARGVFLYGNYARQLMIGNGIKAEKLHIIYNSLDYVKQLSIRAQLKRNNVYPEKFKNYYPVLIFIGRIEPGKCIDQLIDVINLSEKKGKILNLVLIGDGSDKARLMTYAGEIGVLPRIWFLGACYDEDILGNLIYNADICISPGNVGLTAIHALVYGTPVITHNDFKNQMPEFEAIIENSTGAFFKKNDPVSLIHVIGEWINSHPFKSDDLVKSCQKVVDMKYNPDFQINVIRKVLFESCESSR